MSLAVTGGTWAGQSPPAAVPAQEDGPFGNWLSYDIETGQGARDGLPAAADIGIGPSTALILNQDS